MLDDEILDSIMEVLNDFSKHRQLPLGLRHKLKLRMHTIEDEGTEPLVQQGKIPEWAYFVVNGYVEVTFEDENQELQIKRFYGPKSIVAFMSFLTQLPSPFTLQAGCNTKLACISITAMREIFEEWEGMDVFAYQVIAQIDEHIEGIRTRLLKIKRNKRRLNAFYRIYKYLRFVKSLRLEELIGQYLGMSDRSVRRCRDEGDEDTENDL